MVKIANLFNESYIPKDKKYFKRRMKTLILFLYDRIPYENTFKYPWIKFSPLLFINIDKRKITKYFKMKDKSDLHADKMSRVPPLDFLIVK